MAGVVSDLKAQARILHRQILNGTTLDAGRAKRLEALCDCELSALPARVRRRHCLTVIANEFGFRGWTHAAAVLQGTESNDFGILLYPEPGGAQWNDWELIGRDWVRPRLPAARVRLYGKLVRHRAEQRAVSAVA